MDKNKDKDYEQETYTVPTDVMLEIAQIILQADLAHEIIGLKENKGIIIMSISHQKNLKFHQEAIKNITAILKDYHEICSEESEAINWREN